MTAEIKKFLERVEKSNPQNYLYLCRFYYQPEKSLGSSAEETIENYQDYGDIKSLVLNPSFFHFLTLLEKEPHFYSGLSLNLLRKLRFILYDSKDFIEHYTPELTNPELQAIFKERKPLSESIIKKYSRLNLISLAGIYYQYAWIYDLDIPKEVLNKINVTTLDNLLFYLALRYDFKYSHEVEPLKEKERIYSRIKNDDYNDLQNCLLAKYEGSSNIAFRYLICENAFLDVVQNDLLPQYLPKVVIEHIIEILTISVDFKTMNAKYENFWALYESLGKERIKSFDYERAKKLITLLQSKMEQPKLKVIKGSKNPQ